MSEATIDVVEGNRLIAEFMGWTIGELTGWLTDTSMCAYRKNEKGGISEAKRLERLQYDSSWDELMPVVEKISRIVAYKDEDQEVTHYPRTFGMLSDEGKPMVRLHACTLFIADTLIEATYNAVIDFIQWHNEQK